LAPDYRSEVPEKDLCFSNGLVRPVRQIRVNSENDIAEFVAVPTRISGKKKPPGERWSALTISVRFRTIFGALSLRSLSLRSTRYGSAA